MVAKKATKKATAPAKATTKAKAPAPAAKKAAAPAKKATAPKQAAAPAVESVASLPDNQFIAFMTELRALADKYLAGNGGAVTAVAVDEKADYKAKLEGLSLPGLRQEAIKRGFDKAEVKQVTDREVIITGLMADKFPEDDAEDEDADDESEEIEGEADDEESDEDDEDESDEDEDEEDDEDEDSDEEGEDESDEGDEDEDEDEEEGDEEDEEGEDEEYSRDELLAMPIKDLRDLVKQTAEMNDEKPPRGYAKWDADTCADYIIGEEEGDEDEESEEEAYTEADYRKMPLAQLKTLATENSVKLPRGLDKKSAKEQKAAVIKALLA